MKRVREIYGIVNVGEGSEKKALLPARKRPPPPPDGLPGEGRKERSRRVSLFKCGSSMQSPTFLHSLYVRAGPYSVRE